MLYGDAKAAFIGWTMGVNHSTKGTETVNAINNLALITGNIGRAGASPFSITGQCNAMGTREAGFASSLPGYRKFESADDREELAALWNVAADRIPTARGLAYPDIIEAAVSQKIRALWIIATNPIVSFPEPGCRCSRRSRRSSSWSCRTDFIPTPTTELAHLVLAGGDLGREGRHLHQLRAAGQQGEHGGRSARRSANRTSNLSRASPRSSVAATSSFPDGPSRETPSRSGSASRRAGCATTPA